MKSKFILQRFLVFFILLISFVAICAGENVKKSVNDNRDDNGETNDEAKDESLDIPVENEPTNITCTRRQNSIMHEIFLAKHKQFPFMVALMSHQNGYLCSGSVVSNGLIITTAQCTDQPISYVLLNTTKDKKDDTTVSLHVIKTEKFPTYTGSDSSKNVGLIYTEKHNSSIASKIQISNYTNKQNIVDIEAIGFGLNTEVGQTKELQYVGLESRAHFETGELVVGYFDCVETKILTCFKDTGGPAIFNNELIGVITNGQEECSKDISATYAINKKMVEILPTYTFKAWLEEKIKKNEEQEPVALVAYPVRPEPEFLDKMSSGMRHNNIPLYITFSCILLSYF